MTVLIMSCDKFSDTWEPFFKCYNKYYPNHPNTFICTEKEICPYFKTIKAEGAWTHRLKYALEQIKDDHVLLMLDDFFIRSKVDLKRINEALEMMQGDDRIACINFELGYKGTGADWVRRKPREPYLNSCQCSIHDRLKLIERLQKPQTPWEWETSVLDSEDHFYINDKELIIDIGYKNHKPFSIKSGKWCREIVPFFQKEGIYMNYLKRGYWD
jgi:hypothetical protein